MFNPSFTITNAILKNIGSIEAAREVILDAPLLPLWEKQFREDAIVRTAHHGTHVEGNQLNFSETKNVLYGMDMVGRPRDVQEVINYRKILHLIEAEFEKEVEKINEPLLKKIHTIVVENILPESEQGTYRTKTVVIRNSQTWEVTFRPPESIEVPFLMREFLYWLNKSSDNEVHPVLKAGIAHHEIVRIHPFIDGNGRVARAIATLLLYLGNYDIRKFFSLEEYYDQDPISYYTSLQKGSAGDITSWLEYFSLGVAIEFDRIKQKVLKLSKDQSLKGRLGGKQIFLTERQAKLIEYIQSVGYLQNQSFKDIISDVSEDTILRDLKELVDANILKKVGKTKAARYVMV